MSAEFEMPDFLKEMLRENTPVIGQVFPTVKEPEEPTLVDIDDYGNEINLKTGRPAWMYPKGEFAPEAFGACHMKYWGTRGQLKRWNAIISELFTNYGVEIKIRRLWLADCIAWAGKKNAGRYSILISIDSVMSLIKNDTLYQIFKINYYKKGTTE